MNKSWASGGIFVRKLIVLAICAKVEKSMRKLIFICYASNTRKVGENDKKSFIKGLKTKATLNSAATRKTRGGQGGHAQKNS